MDEAPIVQAFKNSNLMLTFIVHFIFTTWGTQGYWTPNSYIFYNAFFLGTLICAIILENNSAIITICFSINVMAIVFDIIALTVYFPKEIYGSADRFSAGMAIINLVFRPLTSFGIFQTVKQRMNLGEQGPGAQAGYDAM